MFFSDTLSYLFRISDDLTTVVARLFFPCFPFLFLTYQLRLDEIGSLDSWEICPTANLERERGPLTHPYTHTPVTHTYTHRGSLKHHNFMTLRGHLTHSNTKTLKHKHRGTLTHSNSHMSQTHRGSLTHSNTHMSQTHMAPLTHSHNVIHTHTYIYTVHTHTQRISHLLNVTLVSCIHKQTQGISHKQQGEKTSRDQSNQLEC